MNGREAKVIVAVHDSLLQCTGVGWRRRGRGGGPGGGARGSEGERGGRKEGGEEGGRSGVRQVSNPIPHAVPGTNLVNTGGRGIRVSFGGALQLEFMPFE